MRRRILIITVVIVITVLLAAVILTVKINAPAPDKVSVTAAPSLTVSPLLKMNLLSQDFTNGGMIPAKFACKGENINPELTIQDPVAGAVSLAMIVADPDAPNGTYFHWVFWNLDPAVNEIKAGSVPVGASEGLNGSGARGYTGPCPPSGTHHYNFQLYALNTKLNLGENTTATVLMKAMQGHILGQVTLTGLFSH